MEFRRLYQQVADEIRALIHSGQFPPGSRLPAERDLAQQIGVSRPSLREALIALEIDGRVEIRMGSGVYVCAPVEPAAPLTRALGESPSELLQARAAIEGATVMLAAARMTPAALASLHRLLDAMGDNIAAGQRPVERDRDFHMTIAAQAGNSVMAKLVGSLFDERHSPLNSQISSRFESSATWLAAQGEHGAILAALEAADPIAAQAAMITHLRNSGERWMGS